MIRTNFKSHNEGYPIIGHKLLQLQFAALFMRNIYMDRIAVIRCKYLLNCWSTSVIQEIESLTVILIVEHLWLEWALDKWNSVKLIDFVQF